MFIYESISLFFRLIVELKVRKMKWKPINIIEVVFLSTCIILVFISSVKPQEICTCNCEIEQKIP